MDIDCGMDRACDLTGRWMIQCLNAEKPAEKTAGGEWTLVASSPHIDRTETALLKAGKIKARFSHRYQLVS